MNLGRFGQRLGLCILLCIGAKVSATEESSDRPPTNDGLWVEVEPTNVQNISTMGTYDLVPYRNRRGKWGQVISVAYSSFTPINYEPNYLAANFEDVYGSASLPLLEIQYSVKRNFKFGAVGVDLGVGMYESASSSTLVESDISLTPIRLGATLYLDTLFPDPYLVPYVSGGGYVMTYKETSAGQEFGGSTDVAPYFALGVMLQLNWMEKEAARVSYNDYDIENSFLYLEGRQFTKSEALKDPDFSTGLDWGAGFKVEF